MTAGLNFGGLVGDLYFSVLVGMMTDVVMRVGGDERGGGEMESNDLEGYVSWPTLDCRLWTGGGDRRSVQYFYICFVL